jgi:hypothetical protein
LLQRVADEQLNLHLVIDRQLLHGGDPLAVVEGACQKAQGRARNHGGFYARAVLLDADKLGQVPDRDHRIQPLADAEGFLLVWQRPCHEALLLHHLPGCQTLKPSDAITAKAALERRWPEYRKPMPAARLSEHIGLAQIEAAASVEAGLRDLLLLLGFRPGKNSMSTPFP